MKLRNKFEQLLRKLCAMRDVDGPVDDIRFLVLAHEYATLASKTSLHQTVATKHLIDATTDNSMPCVSETIVYLFFLLQWDELKLFIEKRRDEAEGIPRKSYWAYLLEPFNDDWEDLDIYDPAYR